MKECDNSEVHISSNPVT